MVFFMQTYSIAIIIHHSISKKKKLLSIYNKQAVTINMDSLLLKYTDCVLCILKTAFNMNMNMNVNKITC